MVPAAIDMDVGDTAIDCSGLLRTAVPEIVPEVAVIVEFAPCGTPLANPPAVIVAPADALQVTLEVRFCVLLSL